MAGSLRKRGLARRPGTQVVGFRRWQHRPSALAGTLCARKHSEADDLQAHLRLLISPRASCAEQIKCEKTGLKMSRPSGLRGLRPAYCGTSEAFCLACSIFS